MASPKNWKRDKENEEKRIPYVWQNTKTYQRLMVMKTLAGTYDIEYSNSDLKTGFTSKEKARKWAVKWAKKHPYGNTISFQRFKKGNIKPGTSAKYKDLYLVSMGTRGSKFESGAPSGDARVYKNDRQVDIVSATRLAEEGRLEDYLKSKHAN